MKLLPNGDREPELRFYQYRRQGGSKGDAHHKRILVINFETGLTNVPE